LGMRGLQSQAFDGHGAGLSRDRVAVPSLSAGLPAFELRKSRPTHSRKGRVTPII
jgi:hypothetical protein